MLPDTSSITISRIGWGVLSNSVIGCGLPSSRTSKSSCESVVTSRPSRSVTVTKTRTASPVAAKSWLLPGRAEHSHDTHRERPVRQDPIHHRSPPTMITELGQAPDDEIGMDRA